MANEHLSAASDLLRRAQSAAGCRMRTKHALEAAEWAGRALAEISWTNEPETPRARGYANVILHRAEDIVRGCRKG